MDCFSRDYLKVVFSPLLPTTSRINSSFLILKKDGRFDTRVNSDSMINHKSCAGMVNGDWRHGTLETSFYVMVH